MNGGNENEENRVLAWGRYPYRGVGRVAVNDDTKWPRR
ncbi:hypothetical protein SAMN05444521_3469 [Streptomyces sp. 3214.6]|nr:hypothetical protein SAMN05444521_3469 [Streptomyces sp. 3214.6]